MTLLLLTSFLLAAQEPVALEKPTPPQAAVSSQDMRTTLLIDPKQRAKDYIQAFELLRREKPTLKVNVMTKTGPLLNVSEIAAADNGTLLFIKMPSNQGTKYLILPIEEIQEIVYSP
ncbi:MAG: hypothetical protein FJZ64_00155 [Chlamydiae bacterium]|nr:hypothetical protein [Chlamydiota bacterium]